MLRFIAGQEVSKAIPLRKPEGGMSGEMLGQMTMTVIHRYLESVPWEDVVSLYLGGLADDEDVAIIARAVRALMAGGVEIG